jgi:hypothetical protein
MVTVNARRDLVRHSSPKLFAGEWLNPKEGKQDTWKLMLPR